jgi:hypothetical protein
MFIELYEMALALADDKSVSTCSFASFSLVRARACALRGYWGRMLRASALREADPLHQRVAKAHCSQLRVYWTRCGPL